MQSFEVDAARILQGLMDAGETPDRNSIEFVGDAIRFRVVGTDACGQNSINALESMGLNLNRSESIIQKGESFHYVTIETNSGELWLN